MASYDDYRQAQRAVDFLSDEKFPVEDVTIIGSDLRMVEKVLGRLTWGRALAAGAHEYVIKPFTADAISDKLALLGLLPQQTAGVPA